MHLFHFSATGMKNNCVVTQATFTFTFWTLFSDLEGLDPQLAHVGHQEILSVCNHGKQDKEQGMEKRAFNLIKGLRFINGSILRSNLEIVVPRTLSNSVKKIYCSAD